MATTLAIAGLGGLVTGGIMRAAGRFQFRSVPLRQKCYEANCPSIPSIVHQEIMTTNESLNLKANQIFYVSK